jgi:hypothetical protein
LTGVLPANMSLMEEIQYISVSGNLLSGLPVELTTLPSLIDLQLSANFLLDLPEAYVNDFPSLGTHLHEHVVACVDSKSCWNAASNIGP